MRKLILISMILLSLPSVYSVSIEECYTNPDDTWGCSADGFCYCNITGTCTNGDLLVYNDDIRYILCIPNITDSTAVFSYTDCDYEAGEEIQVMAICDEGHSSEEDIDIYSESGTTTDTWTTTIISGTTTATTVGCLYSCQTTCIDDNEPPLCFEKIAYGGEGCDGYNICCEIIPKDCPATTAPTTTVKRQYTCPYECCVDMPSYEFKPCSGGMYCCPDNKCKKSCEPPVEFPRIGLLSGIALLVPLIILVFYIINVKAKRKREF